MKNKLLSVSLSILIVLSFTACMAKNEQVEETMTTEVSEQTSFEAENASKRENVSLQMQLQDYDGDFIAEIPMFVSDKNDSNISKINEEISEIKAFYNEVKSRNDGVSWAEIKTYPVTTDKYVQAAVTYISYPNYGTDGDIESFNYDTEKGAVVSVEDAYKIQGITENELLNNVKQLFEEIKESNASLKEMDIEGFLIYDDDIEFFVKLDVEYKGADSYDGIYIYKAKDNKLIKYDGSCLESDISRLDKLNPPLYYELSENYYN